MKKTVIFIAAMVLLSDMPVKALDLSAECAYLMTADSGICIYEKNGEERRGMASTTKIMTAVTVLEHCGLDEVAYVSANAAAQEGSSVYLRTGDKINAEDLLYGMLLNSGNDAACAAAELAGGSVENFAGMMNKKAREIGAVNTSFKNPSGLDEEGHYSTAHDMALIASYAMQNEKFRKIVSSKQSQITTGGAVCYLKNHNKLLWNYDGCIGVKTGFTKKTGRCLVSCAEKDGVKLIAVTLGAPDDWNDHKKMLDYGFEETESVAVTQKGEILKSYSGEYGGLNGVAAEQVSYSDKKCRRSKCDVVLHTISEPSGNIYKGEKIGYAEYKIGEKNVACVDLVADRDVTVQKKKTNKKYGLIKKLKKILLKL